jgi:arginine-tRNA-protein transferase
VNAFQPDRSQRRACLKHSDLVATISKPFFSEEHYALYQRYQQARHENGGMDQDDVSQYQEFLIDTQVTSYLVEFRDSNSTRDLRMVSVVDELEDGLSAVYTFYDPLAGQSYGTFNVLWQIEFTRSIGKKYLYLGYWIELCSKMSYKTRFQPCELLQAAQWQPHSP